MNNNMEQDIIIRLENEEDMIINVENEEPININLDDRISIVQSFQHKDLIGLDYESSGHTGFTPSRLNTLPDLNKNSNRMNVLVSVDDEGTLSKISMKEMFGLFIRQGKEIPSDMQSGEYLFLEKGDNN